MHRRLAAARAGENLVRAAGDHLVDVHIALGAAAGLPDDERELIVEMAGGDLGCGPLDGVGLVGGKAVAPVDARCRLLDERSEEHTSELQSLMRISYAVFCL